MNSAIRPATAGFLILCLLAVGGCSANSDPSDRLRFDPASAVEFFDAGLSYIRDVYIDPSDIEELALAGLNGLRRIEPNIAVARSSDRRRFVVLMDGTPVDEIEIANKNDVRTLAETAAHAVAAAQRTSDRLRHASAEAIYEAIFDTIARRLDPYTRYASAEAAREERADRDGFGGIGITIEIHPDGALIASVKKGQPAESTGLLVGDRILAIAGHSISGFPLRRIVNLLRGPVGKTVALTIRRDALGEPFEISVRRERIVLQTVYLSRDKDFAHIRVTGFNQETSHELRAAADTAYRDLGSRLRGLIIDMRGNPGGLLDQAVEIADLFLDHGAILRTRGRHPRSQQFFDANSETIAKGLPIAVLMDGASASAAEIVASALQDQGRAIVVGASSFGKGTVQQVLRLPNDGELILTWARMHAPSGYVLHKLGVLPTVCSGKLQRDSGNIAEALDKISVQIRQDFRARRNADNADEEAQAAIKALCPWQPQEGGDFDLEIAERVLERRPLYNKMLAQARTGTGS